MQWTFYNFTGSRKVFFNMTNLEVVFLVLFIIACVTAIAFLVLFYILPKNKIKDAERSADKILSDASSKAEKLIADAKLEAKSDAETIKYNAEKEIAERKENLIKTEAKLEQREKVQETREATFETREKALEQRDKTLEQREKTLEQRENGINSREDMLEQKKSEYENNVKELAVKEKDLQEKTEAVINELQKVAQMTIEEAKDLLMERVEEAEAKKIALYKEQMEEEAQSQCEDRARILLANALERYAQEVTCERCSSTVALPSDEMKGRIIGREGRNIKTIESILGVSIIIDDTPETLTVSCFDPVRREIAKLTLEALIRDGRIQPGRISDVYEKIKKEIHDKIKRVGEQTVFKLGLPRISPELLPYIGALSYRTSYGQNVLDHSIQVAYLSSVMASELGLDPVIAKRAGLLHDIGKARDTEVEGSHVFLGAELAKKCNEPAIVINAIESHHGDVPKNTIYSEIVAAADTLSAARPGARSETLETYIKRLEQLETICKSFQGVQNSYALQSGRDVRVMVIPEKVSDEDAKVMAQQIRDRIEGEMEYPGQIKISVIRETRAVETAK